MNPTQTDMFNGEQEQAHARRTDPETSHQAAASILDLRDRQLAVLQCFKAHGDMTQEELVEHYNLGGYMPQSVSGIRTRASELATKGFIVDSGITRKTASGRNAIVWKIQLTGLRE